MSFLSKFRKQRNNNDYKDEIFEHLCDLLNTKRGFGSYPRDLGLDSYIYLGSDRKIILQIIDDIKTCFEKYEKRIRQIEVLHVPNENRFFLSFIIKCKINNNPCSFRLSFHHQKNSYCLEDKK